MTTTPPGTPGPRRLVPADQPASPPLTRREREVLVLVASGRSSKEIADALGITEKTAAHYRERIKMKLRIPRTAGLILYAVQQHMIEP